MVADGLTGRQLAELRHALRSYCRKRYPSLYEDIDDLTGQTLSDLWEYLAARALDAVLPLDAVRRLAFAIFRRRAVDLLRSAARQWALDGAGAGVAQQQRQESEESEGGGAAGVSNTVLYRHMLRVCLAELAVAPEADRALLALVVDGGQQAAMSGRDRQRLRRLRLRLADAVRRELGEDARRLLRDQL